LHTTHLLYLHGFRSSPRSTKAQRMGAEIERLRREGRPAPLWWCPQLPPSPREAAELITAGVAGWPGDSMAVVGSSLGGFYATVLAERRGCPAVLLNPAVDPARDLARQVGPQFGWHAPGQPFEFEPRFVDELRALTPPAITRPQRYLAVIAKGDEVLDWHEMNARYAGARLRLLEGGDHALSDFDRHLPDILAFLAEPPAAPAAASPRQPGMKG
jgi:predicted esterase YcpF (UPF0227 family)